MRADKERIRPGLGADSCESATAAEAPTTSLLPAPLENPKALAAGWAVLLVRSDDRVTRQVYLSLHSATKALERARDGGRDARMVLVELVPAVTAPVYLLGGEDR